MWPLMGQSWCNWRNLIMVGREMWRKTLKEAAVHMSLWERFANPTGNIWNIQVIIMLLLWQKFIFKYSWETPNNLPSALSVSLTLHAHGQIFVKTAFYTSVEAFSGIFVQCSGHSLSCCFTVSFSRQKNAMLHPQTVVKQILHQPTENTNRGCTFQANR